MIAAAVTDADEWRELVSTAFIPLDVERAPGPFAASLRTSQLGRDTTVSLVANTQSTMARTERGISRGDDDSIFLSLNRSRAFTVAQEGRTALLHRGWACFTASSLPYDLVCPGRIEQVVVKLPRAALPVARTAQLDALARPYAPGHEEMAFLRSFVAGVLESADAAGEAAAEALRQTLIDLSALALQSGIGEAAPGRMERASLYHAMLAFVRVNAHERDLTPQALADRFHVSRRLVFQLFEENGTSPAAEIRSERLRRAAVLLRASDASIGSVARQAGFGDLSTFARVFQNEYDALPSEWRDRPSR
jgi:AraC-like DNA-binding protein